MGSQRMTTSVLAGVMAAITVGAVMAALVLVAPRWIVGDRSGLTVVDQLNAENDVRSTLLQGVGGFLALAGVTVGAMMTLRQVRASREGHSIDLFTKAVELLASEQTSVRHGGVYALEQLADLDERYRGHAHALLTAFVCAQIPWLPTGPESGVSASPQPVHGRLQDDVSGALGALGRQRMIVADAWSELEKVDLRYADLDKLNIPRLCLAHSNLEGASLAGANLNGATLADAILRATNLRSADLRGADLSRADLDGAILLGADLTSAKLSDANLRGVIADDSTIWPRGFMPPDEDSPDGTILAS
jgi:Pentapeptide repeats (8 copies)